MAGGPPKRVAAIVLAGSRRGEIDPVATAFGVRAKARVTAFGQPMINRVLQALSGVPDICEIIIVVEPNQLIQSDLDACSGTPCALVTPQQTLSQSVLTAMASSEGAEKFLVTTADHPLLTPDILTDFLDQTHPEDDIAIGLVDRDTIQRTYPGAQRTYMKFGARSVSGANLFVLNRQRCGVALKLWVGLEAKRKSPIKMAWSLGILNLLRFCVGSRSLEAVFKRLSGITNCKITPKMIGHADAAIDVDKLSDLLMVDGILARRHLEQQSSDYGWSKYETNTI